MLKYLIIPSVLYCFFIYFNNCEFDIDLYSNDRSDGWHFLADRLHASHSPCAALVKLRLQLYLKKNYSELVIFSV